MSSSFDYSVYYRRWHKDTDSHYQQMASGYERFLSRHLSAHSTDCRVLDYGAGAGVLTYYLKRRFRDVVGVDSSPELVELATKRSLPVGLISQSDFSSWVSAHRSAFDIVFLFDVLEHVEVRDQITFLKELVSVLKEDGCIYVKVPNANSLLASRWRYNDWTHRSSFTECSLDFVCVNAGLDRIEYLDDDSSVRPRLVWIPRWSIRYYYLKMVFRWIWRLYLRSEIGAQVDTIKVGYNLLIRASRGAR